MTTTEPSTPEPPRPVQQLMHDLLQVNHRMLVAATTPGEETGLPAGALEALIAHYAAAAAFLLWRLDSVDDDSNDVAAELAQLMAYGEPLAEWAGELMDAYGVESA